MGTLGRARGRRGERIRGVDVRTRSILVFFSFSSSKSWRKMESKLDRDKKLSYAGRSGHDSRFFPLSYKWRGGLVYATESEKTPGSSNRIKGTRTVRSATRVASREALRPRSENCAQVPVLRNV
ncbi:PREDICTED: uncharacterized protein LOC105561835 [Vollenhovia emeryi]|uniref:uncharacterized protein LOC105561835 n=1 Tax=Vollenhovia emeryi TaxID=411798 RepID=UPI0005F40B65|nr:PREDICTED: uncharacterized protein LOC105561835 [Vollenhovia emeryi]